MPHGVIADISQQSAALRAGADYLEPTVVGGLVVEVSAGTWRAADVGPIEAIGSCAVLLPSTLRIADPSVPIAQIRQYLDTALGAVGAIARPGAKVVLGSGAARTIGADVPRERGEARFAEVVHLARDLAQQRDLEIILEPLRREETDLIHSITEAARYLDAHGLEDMRIVADLFHVQHEGESLHAVEEHAGRIGHIHVADSGRTPPGQADWPIADFLAALRRGGCTSDVTIECSWGDLAEELPSALAVVREADPLSPASPPAEPPRADRPSRRRLLPDPSAAE
jgi:D-psicose/D-tagatose/L-ribulose 3-epimerase